MLNRQIDPAKAEGLLKILEDPRFQQCLQNGRDTKEKIAEEVLRRFIDRIEEKK